MFVLFYNLFKKIKDSVIEKSNIISSIVALIVMYRIIFVTKLNLKFWHDLTVNNNYIVLILLSLVVHAISYNFSNIFGDLTREKLYTFNIKKVNIYN